MLVCSDGDALMFLAAATSFETRYSTPDPAPDLSQRAQSREKFSSISRRTLDLFRAYEWPGNIRELQNVIERAVITCDSEQFSVDESWFEPSWFEPLAANLEAREREMIENALRECRGLVAGPYGAAARLKIARTTLDSKIKKFGINRYSFKGDSICS